MDRHVRKKFSEYIIMSDFWKGFFLIIITLAVVVTYSEYKEQKQIHKISAVTIKEQLPVTTPEKQKEVKKVVQFLMDKDAVNIQEKDIKLLQSQTTSKLNQLKIKAISNSENAIDHKVDEIFVETSKNIKNYADWYYSLSGDYARTYKSLKGDVNEFLLNKMQEIVYQPTAFDVKLNSLQQELNQVTSDEIQQAKAEMAQNIGEFITKYKIQDDENIQINSSINLSESFKKSFSIPTATIAQRAMVKFSGLALGTFAVKVLTTKLLAKKTFQVAAASFAKLIVKKTGSVLGSSAIGTGVCAAAGPAALLCGATAGLATWVAVDKAGIKIDEHLHRKKFEMEIQQALNEQNDEIKNKLKSIYGDILNQSFTDINNQISNAVEPGP